MSGSSDAWNRLSRDPSIQFHWPKPEEQPLVLEPLHPISVPHLGPWLFWTIVGVAVVAVLLLLIPQVRAGFGRRRAEPAGGSASMPEAQPAPVLLPEHGLRQAEALAAEGRYGDAVHALLLNGVAAIDRRFPRALSPASTSRDIGRLPVLPEAMRAAFGRVAATAERAVFGTRALSRADWEACRAQYAAWSDGRT